MRIYLDNSATSWPKPPGVIEAVCNYLTNCGASPGRSGHTMSLEAARIVFDTRELVAELFNTGSSEKVIFTANATLAINTALNGILKKGDHVIISHMEHNATIRPLRHLEQQGFIELTIVKCDIKGNIDTNELKNCFRPNTRMVVTIHGSNVSGTIFPIQKIGEICRSKGVIYLVDAAQTAGILPIDMQAGHIGILAFTGHKKLYGPPGTGGLCINGDFNIDSLIRGGTGSRSESEIHPDFYPDKLEAGTLNTAGIAGLKAGIEFIKQEGIENIRTHLQNLTNYFINELNNIEEFVIYGPEAKADRLPVISITSGKIWPDVMSHILDKEYGILTRPGLHCCPLGHQALGTFPKGTLRFSPGHFQTEEDLNYTIDALKKIIHNKKTTW